MKVTATSSRRLGPMPPRARRWGPFERAAAADTSRRRRGRFRTSATRARATAGDEDVDEVIPRARGGFARTRTTRRRVVEV